MSSPEVRALRLPVLVTSALGLAAVVVAGVSKGAAGVVGAVIGWLVVVLFFGSGQVVVGRVLRTNPALGMNVALLTYIVQIGALFVLLVVFRDTTWFDGRVFGLTIVACAVAWLLASVRGYLRRDVPYVVPGSGPERDAATGRARTADDGRGEPA